MDAQSPQNQADALAQAQATIARQADDLLKLQQRLQREEFAQELRLLLINSQVVNTVLSPFTSTHLLEMVVQTATRVISARSGSLFLLDEEANDLVFKVAVGPAAQEVKKFRVPLGHGFAGLVAETGQPMAASNVQHDDRLAKDIALSVNYLPESILCLPLFYDGKIIGVLELLDKIGSPSFSMADMETLGLFANMSAVAIVQSQAFQDQQTILNGWLRAFRERDPQTRQRLYQEARAFSEWMNSEDTLNIKAHKLALLVQDLLLTGDLGCNLSINVLQNIVDYTHILQYSI